MSADPALSVDHLAKTFDGLRAVDDLCLSVRRGEIYGFLGPNGAGKTTTIKIILGLMFQDAGAVRIGGRDLAKDPHEIKRRIGFLPEHIAFYNNLTALETLQFYAELKGAVDEPLLDHLEAVGLRPFADEKVGTFSKGMVQLLGIAQTLIGDPELLILDEPTTGLDPNWARTVKDRIQAANERGATVFFSSHILGQVQELADRVGIVDRGKLIAEDTVENLGRRLDLKPRLRLTVEESLGAATRAVSNVEGVVSVESSGAELVVLCDRAAKARVLGRLEAMGISVRDFRTEEPGLEEVFIKLTGARRSVR